MYLSRFSSSASELVRAYRNRLIFRKLRKSYSNKSTLHCYIIYRNSASSGLFSNVALFFSEVEYALINGYAPFIDMQHYPSQALSYKQLRSSSTNIWDLFYDQPSNITAREAYSSSNIRTNHGSSIVNQFFLPFNMHWSLNKHFLASKKYLFQECFKVSSSMRHQIKANVINIFPKIHKSIGLNIRGTCYSRPVKGHPIQPSLDYFAQKCDHLLDTQDFTNIYLTTIDADVQAFFQRRYGSRLLYYSRETYSSSTTDLFGDIHLNENIIKHLSDYFVSIYLHRECSFVLGGLCSSSLILPLILDDNTKSLFPCLGFHP